MIEVSSHAASVQRKVAPATIDGDEWRVVTLTREYDTTVEDLWEACTSPERIPRWFLPVSGDLRIGGRFQLEGNAGGTIEACDPPHRFRATWEFGEQTSWIEVTILETADGARLQLDHTVPTDSHWEQFGPGAVGAGWDLGLVGLTLHLASGETVDPVEVGQWMASEEGRSLVIAACEAWRDADIAGGTPEDVARAAAERTTAAYTGEA